MTRAVDKRVALALRSRVESLFVSHVDAVFNIAYRVLWNRADAEDVVQAVFVKAFTRLHQLDDLTRVKPWILQIAYREAITIVRQRRDVPLTRPICRKLRVASLVRPITQFLPTS